MLRIWLVQGVSHDVKASNLTGGRLDDRWMTKKTNGAIYDQMLSYVAKKHHPQRWKGLWVTQKQYLDGSMWPKSDACVGNRPKEWRIRGAGVISGFERPWETATPE